jgi:hypothetical protein
MVVRRATPSEAALAAPKSDECDRCGAGPDGDLRLIVFRGRVRYAERTVCDTCAEELFEMFFDAPITV